VPTPAELEASWTPTGASCINMDSPDLRRRPGAKWPPVSGVVFDGTCSGVPLQPCTSLGMLAEKEQ
jgi:hypothetical protein